MQVNDKTRIINGPAFGEQVNIEELESFSSIDSFSTIIVGVEPGTEQTIPTTYELSQNYPNPFNPTTTIKYALPEFSKVTLTIYNLRGEEIVRLVDGEQQAGFHWITWDASIYSSGIYLYRLQAVDFVQTRKMILLK